MPNNPLRTIFKLLAMAAIASSTEKRVTYEQGQNFVQGDDIIDIQEHNLTSLVEEIRKEKGLEFSLETYSSSELPDGREFSFGEIHEISERRGPIQTDPIIDGSNDVSYRFFNRIPSDQPTQSSNIYLEITDLNTHQSTQILVPNSIIKNEQTVIGYKLISPGHIAVLYASIGTDGVVVNKIVQILRIDKDRNATSLPINIDSESYLALPLSKIFDPQLVDNGSPTIEIVDGLLEVEITENEKITAAKFPQNQDGNFRFEPLPDIDLTQPITLVVNGSRCSVFEDANGMNVTIEDNEFHFGNKTLRAIDKDTIEAIYRAANAGKNTGDVPVIDCTKSGNTFTINDHSSFESHNDTVSIVNSSPTPAPTNSPTKAPTNNTGIEDESDLSKGAVAGIAVGAGIAGLALVACCCVYAKKVMQRRRDVPAPVVGAPAALGVVGDNGLLSL
ncbi:MAG: hypothetical protein K0R25_778 [Rickettsiaceae bacterium]|jgi:hypothetical protein|nr:hypothetical protein [Rickettsiaceae bacterium]